ADKTTKQYKVSDIRWTIGDEDITGSGSYDVRYPDGEAEGMLALDLDIAGAPKDDWLPRVAMTLTDHPSDSPWYTAAVFIDATRLPPPCNADFDGDRTVGTDEDIRAFFECVAGKCCATCRSADVDGDGAVATDADIEGFFRVL